VQQFVATLAPLLAQAMQWRTQGLKLKEFRQQAGSGNLTLNPGVGNTNTVGTLQTTAGDITLESGTMNVTASGGVMGPGLYLNGGTLTVAGGTLNATAGDYATINNGGTLSVTSGICNLNNNGELLNGYETAGTINLSGTGVLNVNVLRICHACVCGLRLKLSNWATLAA
jgi:hypothetical protein